MFRAHELVAALAKSNFKEEGELCAAATKFDIGEHADLVEMYNLSSKEFFQIPSPLCLFQVESDGGYFFYLGMAVNGENGDEWIVWRRFFASAQFNFEWKTDDRAYWISNSEDGARMGISDFDLSNPRGPSEMTEDEKRLGAQYFGMACAIEVFSCTNVVAVDHPPPKFINAKRIKKGKVPFFSYKTLHITGEASESGESAGGTHASPRLHLRRGHIRKLADGRRVWVRHCLVGDKSKGFVAHDYKVRLAA